MNNSWWYNKRGEKEAEKLSEKYHKKWEDYGLFFYFFCLLFDDFSFFGTHVFKPTFSTKEVNICNNYSYENECNFSKVIKDEFVIINKKYSNEIDRHGPEYGSNNIICPKIFLLHSTCPGDKRDKCTGKIMKLSEYDIPKSIFLYLFMKYSCFRLSDSEPVSISLYKLSPVPLSYPVSEIVSYHCAKYRWYNCHQHMSLPPKSSDEYHHVHPRDGSSYDRKWLYTCREKCDCIIPISECLYEKTYPLNPWFDPLRANEWYSKEGKSKEREGNREKFSDIWEDELEFLFHSSILRRYGFFAKEREYFQKKYYWQFFIMHNMYLLITHLLSMSKWKTYHSPEQFRADHPEEYARQQLEGNKWAIKLATIVLAGVLSITLATSEKAQDLVLAAKDAILAQVITIMTMENRY